MTKQELTTRITAYLAERFLAKGVQYNPVAPFTEYGIDSMTVVELVMFMEEEFGIVIPAEQLTADNLKSVASLVNCAVSNQK